MVFLQCKNIVLGISGGIAAYKAPELVRRLKEQGANVRVVMTQSAQAFVTPLSLQAVSAHPVADDLLDPQAELAMGHIELAKWADMLLIAPATANIIAKITHGIADDLLTTLCLASSAPLCLAPAMNKVMWYADATQVNIETLQRRNVQLFGPGEGEQACGDFGKGRMLDVDDLVTACIDFFASKQAQNLLNKHIVITAGPTREAIDPVRYISNHSSGKMGYALAQAAINQGAKVTLISGPVSLKAPQHSHLISVTSAAQMHNAAMAYAKACDVFIACAAVADYKTIQIAEQKIKKSADTMTLTLTKNPDIVADVSSLTENRPFTVGFAAETQDIEHYAKNKLEKKNLDMIAANDVAKSNQGFNSDHNALMVLSKNSRIDINLASKKHVAEQLMALIAQSITTQES